MLRLNVFVSAVPLLAVAVFARFEFVSASLPCIAIGADTLQIASAPWHADLHVSFTDDPKLATVRVAVSDSAETADFAVIDDVDDTDDSACRSTPATQFVAISAERSASAPVIYLSHDAGPSDYRIFVHSTRLSEQDAAALVVGARSDHPRLASAVL
jgi:hypothetical protein